MFSHPELGSDPPIGSGRELGRDTTDHAYIILSQLISTCW